MQQNQCRFSAEGLNTLLAATCLALKKLRAAIAGRPHCELFLAKRWLDALDVLSWPALGAFDHVKLNLLTFLQTAEPASLNGREMHEDILTVLAADETVA